jgi:hypothetical protein
MIEQQNNRAGTDRRWLWCAVIALFGVIVSWIYVPTRLGVKVPETAIPGIDASTIDLTGRERIWRVWWRARDDFIEMDPQWIMTIGLIVLFAIFALGVLAAIWIALSPETETVDVQE